MPTITHPCQSHKGIKQKLHTTYWGVYQPSGTAKSATAKCARNHAVESQTTFRENKHLIFQSPSVTNDSPTKQQHGPRAKPKAEIKYAIFKQHTLQKAENKYLISQQPAVMNDSPTTQQRKDRAQGKAQGWRMVMNKSNM